MQLFMLAILGRVAVVVSLSVHSGAKEQQLGAYTDAVEEAKMWSATVRIHPEDAALSELRKRNPGVDFGLPLVELGLKKRKPLQVNTTHCIHAASMLLLVHACTSQHVATYLLQMMTLLLLALHGRMYCA
jgi:hypothetical protein